VNNVAGEKMPWEELLFSPGDLTHVVPASLDIPINVCKKVSLAREQALVFLHGGPHTIPEMVTIMQDKKNTLRKLDRSIVCDIEYLTECVPDLLRLKLEAMTLKCLPSTTSPLGFAESSNLLDELFKSPQYYALPSFQSDVQAVRNLVKTLQKDYNPNLRGHSAFSPFFKMALKHVELFYSIDAPLAVQPKSIKSLSFQTAAKRLFGADALRHVYDAAKATADAGKVSMMVDLRPLKMYGWIFTHAETELIKEWVQAAGGVTVEAAYKMISDKAHGEVEETLVPFTASSSSSSSSKDALVVVATSAPEDKATLLKTKAKTNMMKFFMPKSKP
jgi:hypothetical protein